MVDCLKEICWKPLGVALAVVFGFLMLIFCILSFMVARKIKGFDDEDDSIFEYHSKAFKASAWSQVISLLQRKGRVLKPAS
jgi:hypothetical protein